MNVPLRDGAIAEQLSKALSQANPVDNVNAFLLELS